MGFNPRDYTLVSAPHPATLEDVALLKQCSIAFGRATGPGGQHRNRRSTSASLVHDATGLQGSICVPCFAGEEVVGTLGIANHGKREFTSEETALLLEAGRRIGALPPG